jgi:biopolymer transport protein ExbD
MDIIESKEKKAFENILPLVNIVFLLLIFFMVAGTFIKPDILAVTIPNAKTEIKAKNNVLIIVMSHKNQFSIGTKLYEKEALINVVASRITLEESFVVQLKADHRVKSKDILDIMNTLGSTGLESVQLLTSNNLSPVN